LIDQEKYKTLIEFYQHKIQTIKNNMPHAVKWGSDAYQKHELRLCEQFLKQLQMMEVPDAK
jgi:hypothetical protein